MRLKRSLCGLGLIFGVSLWLAGCGLDKRDGYEITESAGTTLADVGSTSRVLLLEDLDKDAESDDAGREDDGDGSAQVGGVEAGDVETVLGGACCGEATHFAYDRLTEAEKIWYVDMSRTLREMATNRELSGKGLDAGLTEGDIDKIFQCVLGDHPEYFYVEGYTYTRFTRMEKTVKLEFSGTYSVSREEALRRASEIQDAAGEILEGISMEASDYDKVKYVYETVIRGTEYDMNAPDNQNMYSVFAGHFSVCQGYAKAVQYLLNRLGVECTMVTGTVDTGEGHAWNLVKVDGQYYYVDATWGDASYIQDESLEADILQFPEINYDYLCVNTEQLLRTHSLGNVVAVPQCTALENNYYVREGVYFTAVDEAQLAECFQRAREGGKSDVTLKCADAAVYGELYDRLITKQGIFDHMDSEGGNIAYTQNEKQLSMTFWVTSG